MGKKIYKILIFFFTFMFLFIFNACFGKAEVCNASSSVVVFAPTHETDHSNTGWHEFNVDIKICLDYEGGTIKIIYTKDNTVTSDEQTISNQGGQDFAFGKNFTESGKYYVKAEIRKPDGTGLKESNSITIEIEGNTLVNIDLYQIATKTKRDPIEDNGNILWETYTRDFLYYPEVVRNNLFESGRRTFTTRKTVDKAVIESADLKNIDNFRKWITNMIGVEYNTLPPTTVILVLLDEDSNGVFLLGPKWLGGTLSGIKAPICVVSENRIRTATTPSNGKTPNEKSRNLMTNGTCMHELGHGAGLKDSGCTDPKCVMISEGLIDPEKQYRVAKFCSHHLDKLINPVKQKSNEFTNNLQKGK